MRMLNIDEVNVVSGGRDAESPDFDSYSASELETVPVTAKRISFGRLSGAVRLGRLATPLGILVGAGGGLGKKSTAYKMKSMTGKRKRSSSRTSWRKLWSKGIGREMLCRLSTV